MSVESDCYFSSNCPNVNPRLWQGSFSGLPSARGILSIFLLWFSISCFIVDVVAVVVVVVFLIRSLIQIKWTTIINFPQIFFSYSSGFLSTIIGHNFKFQDQLLRWLSEVEYGEKYWAPCYRGTKDGWSKESFHAKCDNAGPTVTLARRENYLFGGFSDHSWQSKNVFNLSWVRLVFILHARSETQISHRLMRTLSITSVARLLGVDPLNAYTVPPARILKEEGWAWGWQSHPLKKTLGHGN